MMRNTLTHLAVVFLGSSACADNGPVLAERLVRITSATRWQAIREIPLQFDAFHPQGMALANGAIYVSSVEVINRAQGKGKGHIFRIAQDGSLAAQAELTDGVRYHPGGLDYDGARLWVPVAEYRADSSSVVYALDPATLNAREVFRANDHLGAIVHDPVSATMAGMNWGSRRLYRWSSALEGKRVRVDASRPAEQANRSHYVDLQDGQWLSGTTLMLCGGLKNYRGPNGNFALGGLEVIDMQTFEPKHQAPVPLWEPGGRPMLQNAFHCEATETGLRFWFLPGDGKAAIYVYEPELHEK